MLSYNQYIEVSDYLKLLLCFRILEIPVDERESVVVVCLEDGAPITLLIL